MVVPEKTSRSKQLNLFMFNYISFWINFVLPVFWVLYFVFLDTIPYYTLLYPTVGPGSVLSLFEATCIK